MSIKLTTIVGVIVCTLHSISWLHVFAHLLNFFYIMTQLQAYCIHFYSVRVTNLTLWENGSLLYMSLRITQMLLLLGLKNYYQWPGILTATAGPGKTFLLGRSGKKILKLCFLKQHMLVYFIFFSYSRAPKCHGARGNLPPLLTSSLDGPASNRRLSGLDC